VYATHVYWLHRDRNRRRREAPHYPAIARLCGHHPEWAQTPDALTAQTLRRLTKIEDHPFVRCPTTYCA